MNLQLPAHSHGPRYYLRDGTPTTLMGWAEKYEDPNYKIVKQTHFKGVGGSVMLSTVWLGLDHSWGEGPPLIFETMIFGLSEDEFQYRYATEREALLGHAKCEDLLLERFLLVPELTDGPMKLPEGVVDGDTCE